MSRKRVLILDDEDLVIEVVTTMLEYMGYEVESSREGDETVEKYRSAMERGTPFHAVLLDLSIPGGRGGREVIRDLLSIDPHVCAVVSSGYSNDPIMTNYTQYGFKGVVAKPFKLEDLRDVMNKVLGL